MEFSSPEPLISIFPFQFLLIGEGQQEYPTGELGREQRYVGLAWHKHSRPFWIRPCLHQASGALSPGPQPSTTRELQKLRGLCILGLLLLFPLPGSLCPLTGSHPSLQISLLKQHQPPGLPWPSGVSNQLTPTPQPLFLFLGCVFLQSSLNVWAFR